VGKLIRLDSHRYPWREAMTVDGSASTLQVYVNARTGELEFVQSNDDAEVIRTVISSSDVDQLQRIISGRGPAGRT